MHNCSGVLIFGIGGHARAVADIALSAGIEALLFIDENARVGEKCYGFPVQKTFEGLLPQGWQCMPASGNNQKRKAQIEIAQSLGWPLATLISPTATVGIEAQIGSGSLIAHKAYVGPSAKIGAGSIINTSAVVEHECVIGDHVHISINATIAGRSSIGNFSSIFAGSVVIDNLSVCDNVTLGAGSVLLKDALQPGLYVGTPAILKR